MVEPAKGTLREARRPLTTPGLPWMRGPERRQPENDKYVVCVIAEAVALPHRCAVADHSR